jgi:hypothetical protein
MYQHGQRSTVNTHPVPRETYPWRFSAQVRSFISPDRRLVSHRSRFFSTGSSSWNIALAPSNSFESHLEKYCAKVDVNDWMCTNCSMTRVLAMAWSASKDAGFDFGSAVAVCCSARKVRRIRALKERRLNLNRPWIDDLSDSNDSGRYACA